MPWSILPADGIVFDGSLLGIPGTIVTDAAASMSTARSSPCRIVCTACRRSCAKAAPRRAGGQPRAFWCMRQAAGCHRIRTRPRELSISAARRVRRRRLPCLTTHPARRTFFAVRREPQRARQALSVPRRPGHSGRNTSPATTTFAGQVLSGRSCSITPKEGEKEPRAPLGMPLAHRCFTARRSTLAAPAEAQVPRDVGGSGWRVSG